MGSLSISEILTILVVILVIFGPDRLPEFVREGRAVWDVCVGLGFEVGG